MFTFVSWLLPASLILAGAFYEHTFSLAVGIGLAAGLSLAGSV